MKTISTLTLGLLAMSGMLCASDMTAERLRVEYLENPQGIDAAPPRFSWELRDTRRGARQTAYRILVASDAGRLARDEGNLWDSGKVSSRETLGIEYAGTPLTSRQRCFWKVQVWDGDEQASAWSAPAEWSMGLLASSDWKAQWITAPPVQPATTAHFGYRSKLASSVDTAKWVQIDLGETQTIDSVRLWPTWPLEPGVAAGGGFPLRFRVEVSGQADFAQPRTVIDRTDADVPNPGMEPVNLEFAPAQARFVRLTATRLSGPSQQVWDDAQQNWRAEPAGRGVWLALAEMEVTGGGRNLALGKTVTALDEWDDNPPAVSTGPRQPRFRGLWSREQLTDGRTEVDLGSRFHHQPVTLLRREFQLTKPIRRAVLHATARGMYEIHLNGRKAGDHCLAPGWTMYDKRILYQTHDVTGLLQPGANAIGALLGDGWFRMRKQIDWFGGLERFPGFFHAGERWLLAQLEIEYEDGSRETVVTDRNWNCHSDGPIRRALIFDGFQYDAGKEIPGWDAPGFAEPGDWKLVVEQSVEESPALSAQAMEPIRVRRERKPVARSEPAPGVFVFDFGEQLSGVYRIRVHARAGTEIKIRHAEELRRDGRLYVANLMGLCDQVDRFRLGRGGLQTFSPLFTLYGFRYLEVTGIESAHQIRSIEALELTSGVPHAATFTSSDPRLNQLCATVDRAYRANMPSLTVDTTARDERMPWLGDCYTDEAQSLSYLYDYAAFGANQARAIDDALNSEGIGPVNLGNVCPDGADAVAGWCDASVAAPWVQWLNYADRRALRRGYEGAKRFMDTVAAANPDGVPRKRYRSQFGDWLSSRMTIPPGAKAWEPPGGQGAPQPLFAAAFWAYSAGLTAKMAEALGESEDARRYRDLVKKIRAALAKDHVQPDGTVTGGEQSSYALLLGMDHLEDPLSQSAHAKLLEAIRAYDSHLATGSITTIFLLEHLARSGRQDLAYQLVMQPSCPSYGHMIDSGATSMWERFDGWHPKLGFNPAPMNAFSHLGMNSVYQWIIAHVAGIQPDPAAPGYQRFLVAPRAEAGPEWVKAEYRSIRGPVEVNWKRQPDALELELTVPPNTTAEVRFPTSAPDGVTESGQPAAESPGVTLLRKEKDAAVFEAGSGRYVFRAARPLPPTAATGPGFVQLAEHGTGLSLNGRPYRAIGVNIPHLPQAWMGTWFHRNQFYESPTAMRQAMVEAIEDAARHGVAFVRFFGSPGYPKETAELYHKDKAGYWRQMDELFALCRKHGLKLVPSLGVLSKWHQDFGEPRSAVFDPKTKTHAATYGYVREFVSRYRDDPTVLMWELENEAFLKADVVAEGLPGLPAGVFPEGFATRRETYTAEDNLRFEQLVDFYKQITAFIKELDPNHLVTSGDSGVRPESQARRETFPKFRWRKDTLREHLANLFASQPEPLDVFSLHDYGNFTQATDVSRLSALELLRAKVRAVHAARAPVFIGELGQRDPHFAQDPEAKWTRAAIDLLEEEGVALIALWTWHFPWQEDDHNISTGAEQPLLMKRVAEFNRNTPRNF